jgi:LysM repeat protein
MVLMKTSATPCRARSRALTLILRAIPLLAAISPTGHVDANSCGATYTVTPGDSLWSISATCDVPITTITRLNLLATYLQPGQVLQMRAPAAPHFYVVQPGDTLSRIAQRLALTPAMLAVQNGITDRNIVRVGAVLRWRLDDVQTTATVSPAPAAHGVSLTAAQTTAIVGPAPAAATSPPPQAEVKDSFRSGHVRASVTYTVRPGDTLWTIAIAYHVDIAALAAANGMSDPNVLLAGITLSIPPATAAAPAAPRPSTMTPNVTMNTYVVQPGDTLSGIGRALGLTTQALAQANALDPALPIRPAQVLRYPVSVHTGPAPAPVLHAPVIVPTGPTGSTPTVGAVLDQQAVAVGVDSALLKAVAWRESNWRMVDAPDGGIGVMQLMPDTVRWLKVFHIPGVWDPHDLTANVHAGAVLLLLYSRLYGGDVARIAAAYHGGMGALLQPYATAEMARYVGTVIAYRRAFLDGTCPA